MVDRPMAGLKKILFTVAAVLVFFLALEGLASVIFVLKNRAAVSSLDERKYTKYDSRLGWVGAPNTTLNDYFGKGKHVKINSQSFRATRDYSITVPDKKTRIVCSGDSFTFGHGVGNDHTLCHELQNMNPKIETINMGQSGYGLDQAYLWYKRDGKKFAHNIHLMLLIVDDFSRMETSNYFGNEKPILDVKNNQIVVKNVPVPRIKKAFPSLAKNIALFRFHDLFRSFGLKKKEFSSNAPHVCKFLFQDLKRINREKGSTLVVVLLPKLESRSEAEIYLMSWLSTQLKNLNIPLIDLIPEYTQRSQVEKEELIHFHYSEKGNRVFAERLYESLLGIPEITALLEN